MSALRKLLVQWVAGGTATVSAFQRGAGVTVEGPTRLGLHVLFCAGASLGNELFFISFLPWLFWEFDLQVARRSVFLWTTSYYVGQLIKDILTLPRPPPAVVMDGAGVGSILRLVRGRTTPQPPGTPAAAAFAAGTAVVRLERHYETEYGMPSTHAMNAVAMPGLLLLLTLASGRFDGSVRALQAGCGLWFLLCTTSRLYMGVHSPADIVTGLALGFAVLGGSLSVGHQLDMWILSGVHAGWALPLLAVLGVATYPRPFGPGKPRWHATPGDTAMCAGAGLGVALGSRAFGSVHVAAMASDGPLFGAFPAEQVWGMPARMVIGCCTLLLTRAVVKSVCMAACVAVLGDEFAPASEVGDADAEADSEGRHAAERLIGGEASAWLLPTPLARALRPETPPAGTKGVRRRAHIPLVYEGGGAAGGVGAPAPSREGGAGPKGLRIGIPSDELVRVPPRRRYAVELPTKLLTYTAVGVQALFTVPLLFQAMGLRQYGFVAPHWVGQGVGVLRSMTSWA